MKSLDSFLISIFYISGTLTVEEVYKDRDQFASLVREVLWNLSKISSLSIHNLILMLLFQEFNKTVYFYFRSPHPMLEEWESKFYHLQSRMFMIP